MAHECIIDLRQIEKTGITTEDVAKRLIDYGFHAPTMSWPVPETLMIEPTESEDLSELDRFCDAMIAICGEIAEVERGEADPQNNVLEHAPHTHRALIAEWTRPYSREKAFFPMRLDPRRQILAAGGRVDNVHGDRNLVCACPPPGCLSRGGGVAAQG